jgi:hypothetical protein
MDIKEFVSSTILQIMEAVAESQEQAVALGGYVNPTAHSMPKDGAHIGFTATGQVIYAIDFDVAVTVASESGTEAGGRLQVASIVSIGAKGKGSDKSETMSRVKFAVPVMLPIDSHSKEERDARKRKADAAMQQHSAAIRTPWRGEALCWKATPVYRYVQEAIVADGIAVLVEMIV